MSPFSINVHLRPCPGTFWRMPRTVIGRLEFYEVSNSISEVLNSLMGSLVLFDLHLKLADLFEQLVDLVSLGRDCRDCLFVELFVVRFFLGNGDFDLFTTGFLSAASTGFDDFAGFRIEFPDKMPSSARLFLVRIPMRAGFVHVCYGSAFGLNIGAPR